LGFKSSASGFDSWRQRPDPDPGKVASLAQALEGWMEADSFAKPPLQDSVKTLTQLCARLGSFSQFQNTFATEFIQLTGSMLADLASSNAALDKKSFFPAIRNMAMYNVPEPFWLDSDLFSDVSFVTSALQLQYPPPAPLTSPPPSNDVRFARYSVTYWVLNLAIALQAIQDVILPPDAKNLVQPSDPVFLDLGMTAMAGLFFGVRNVLPSNIPTADYLNDHPARNFHNLIFSAAMTGQLQAYQGGTNSPVPASMLPLLEMSTLVTFLRFLASLKWFSTASPANPAEKQLDSLVCAVEGSLGNMFIGWAVRSLPDTVCIFLFCSPFISRLLFSHFLLALTKSAQAATYNCSACNGEGPSQSAYVPF
jgi:hypothetical protein